MAVFMAGSFSSWMSSKRTFTLRTRFLVPDSHTQTHTTKQQLNCFFQHLEVRMTICNLTLIRRISFHLAQLIHLGSLPLGVIWGDRFNGRAHFDRCDVADKRLFRFRQKWRRASRKQASTLMLLFHPCCPI